MDNIDYDELIDFTKKHTKKAFATYTFNNKIVNNLANLGGKPGDIFKLERSGEYYGIAVEIMANIRPLLTQLTIIKYLTMLKKEDYITPLSILHLTDIAQLIYILHKWFSISNTEYKNNLEKYVTKDYHTMDPWITSVTHDPILGKIKVAEIGFNSKTGNSVLPEEWVGREFNDAYELHKEMDKLDTRIGKPPTTYAVIYSMMIQNDDTIIANIAQINVADFDLIFILDFIKGTFIITKSKGKLSNAYQYVRYNKILIGFALGNIFVAKNKDNSSKKKEVGLLVSRLQKAIRRGKYGGKICAETVDGINDSPNYNLPEHAFMRVSACRQLVWRLFITILEDCRPYKEVREPSMLTLMLLTLITEKVQEYKFNNAALEAIKGLALLAQYNDTSNDLYDWRQLEANQSLTIKKMLGTKSDFHLAIALALGNVTMMSGDTAMLSKYYSFDEELVPFKIPTKIYHKKAVYDDIALSSYDMHSKPHIILYYQAAIPLSLKTTEISNYIWDISSSYNVRSGETREVDDTLLKIQKYLMLGMKTVSGKRTRTVEVTLAPPREPSEHLKRQSFLILFGKKFKSKNECVIAGNTAYPIKIKIDDKWEDSNDQSHLNAYPNRKIILKDIDPPFGYKWSKATADTKIVNGIPFVDGKEVAFFDGSSVLVSNQPLVDYDASDFVKRHITKLFSGVEVNFDHIIKISKKSAEKILDWLPSRETVAGFDMELVNMCYTKIYNQFNNLIMIGPVARSGKKMQNSINYLCEGKIWAIFNSFCYLYPDTFRPSGSLNFTINKTSCGYIHLITTLESILFQVGAKVAPAPPPTITTALWDHQNNSVNKIIYGFKNGYYGYGDASKVGSGKTLTSLMIACKLIAETGAHEVHSGILVMLPSNNLINTWREEISKHTKGFDVVYQENDKIDTPIKVNTIVVSTMARVRDYPINHKWLLMVIDECLTVQNKNALWTESAWKQSMLSKHLIMMSATFFRTRFDKLYYMLKMLRSGLPEIKDYLDTILIETIVSQVPNTLRNWKSNINYFTLDKTSRIEYDLIQNSKMKIEVKYAKLIGLLSSSDKIKKSVIGQLKKLITNLENEKRRCLIYANSKQEAEFWSSSLNIPIYPTKSKHCIVTFHDGTYGLNDLIIYNCIIMRPPQPDKLPQIKGRLDRPGNVHTELRIEYFLLKDTIEMGLILRLNIASQFFQKYVMPLAQFYDISINYQKYAHEL